jgi:bifunctional non-homologous end joining protein LigD
MKKKLSAYQSKRDFSKTSEPKGSNERNVHEPIFVVQEHDARALHYDFRIECEGVLKSWAIPKGPSTDPAQKHLAVQTEDHPFEYKDFEGVIPEGNYGAGGVIIWDSGTFKNLKDKPLAQCIKDGEVALYLSGKKLIGGYALIRVKLKTKKTVSGKLHASSVKENSWIFFKMKDDEADTIHNVTKEYPKSVVSGKTVEEIEKEEKS